MSNAKTKMYYIRRCNEFHGNAVVWWGKDHCGYVSNLDEAGRYTEEEAKGICLGSSKPDVAYECDFIDNHPKALKTVVDGSHLSAFDSAFGSPTGV